MPKDFLWQRCEHAWASWLAANGWAVDRLSSIEHNIPGTGAHMIQLPGNAGVVPSPDLVASRMGQRQYWEVKSRAYPDIDPLTGQQYHWMPYTSFKNYADVEYHTGSDVYIALYERRSATTPSRWLVITLKEIMHNGFKAQRINIDGNTIEIIQWPVTQMKHVAGPPIEEDENILNQNSDIPTTLPVQIDVLQIYERNLRQTKPTITANQSIQAIAQDPLLGLTVLQQVLKLPITPRYSVLKIGVQMLDDVLGLLEYGIRVFLITPPHPIHDSLSDRLNAFREARLLEWAIINELDPTYEWWQIDGVNLGSEPAWLRDVIHASDISGQINMAQYDIVHAPIDQDIQITAGAGTGKTETMSERLIFILSTATHSAPTNAKPYQMRLNEIALVTFTRDAAREMRSRISRTIVLRQRLANRCVQPTIAWLLQLGQTHISTIHAFAKRIIQQNGSQLGISPEFVVSQQLMAWNQLTTQALSEPIQELYDTQPKITPPIYEWRKHIRKIWDALENNGVPLISFDRSQSQLSSDSIDWGDDFYTTDPEFVALTHDTITRVCQIFQQHCLTEQTLPTNQLVPTAITTLKRLHPLPLKRPLRYLFVDEFQDTDSLQMNLILTLRNYFHTQLFVVGDAKQGIYRFRGAQGNAFDVLKQRVQTLNLNEFASYSLTRNFRTDGLLLESLHPFFLAWGEANLLQYQPHDQLTPRIEVATTGMPVSFHTIKEKTRYAQEAADCIGTWRSDHPTDSIAVLCRTNLHAIEVQQAIRAQGGRCALLVGGGFFQSPVVRELRVLLEALANPSDDAALIELCNTRWMGGLYTITTPHPLCEDSECWQQPMPKILDWQSRFRSSLTTGHFHRDDLELLRRRIHSLASLTKQMAGMSLVVACRDLLKPEICGLDQPDDETERIRYARGLTHLVTLLDDTFVDSSATMSSILEWLRINIQTNHSEDEPSEPSDIEGITTALTVHKSKGLEFDHVLIPQTWKEPGAPQNAGTEIAIQINTASNADQHYQLRWRWTYKDKKFTNTTTQDTAFWDIDFDETIREETRLLYVAMTRARHTLHIFRTAKTSTHAWDALLKLGSTNA